MSLGEMTSDENFEQWWATQKNGYWDQVNAEKAARAAWLAHADRYAALSPEVIETAIEALNIPIQIERNQAWQENRAEDWQLIERYAAARAVLELLKEKETKE